MSSSSSSSSNVYTAKSVVLIDHLDSGLPEPKHFRIDTTQVDASNLADGELVLRVLVFSADPYLRGQIKSAAGAVKPGGVLRGFVAGKVIASANSTWPVGSLLGASLAFSTYQKLSSDDLKQTFAWDLTKYITEDKISLGIGILGMPGATAYGGYLDVLAPKKGETLFVSGAAGAVGSLVGQIAKAVHECKVIGSCGGPDKVELVKKEFGFDDAIDYKTVADTAQLTQKLKEVTGGNGIDMYFENVGGMHFEAAMNTLRPYGRVAVCGGISGYNSSEIPAVSFNPMKMIYSFQRIEGFMCRPWLTGAKGNFLPDMHKWLTEGKLKVQETNFDGIDNWPLAFQSLFTGKNIGKVVVRVDKD